MPIHELRSGFNRGAFLGETLSNTLKETFESIAEKKKEERHLSSLEKGLKEAESIFMNKNISNAQKEIRLHQALRKHPEAAKRLSDQLFKREVHEDEINQGETKNRDLQNERETTNRFLEKERGLEPESLKGVNPKTAETATRPQKEPKKTQASQPIDPEQLNIIQKVRSSPGYDELDEVDQYRALTNAGVSKENAETEAKLTGAQLTRKGNELEKSYAEQKPFIDDTTKRAVGWESEMKPRLLQMQKMNEKELVSPTAAVFLEAVGIPLGALDDPTSELYNKVSQDLLKGLPETYGSRILKVEVDNFLKTIPTLMNSPVGRRMIASNMLKLGEMKEVYYKEMRKEQMSYLDQNKKLPKDFEQRIFDNVSPQIAKINDEFSQLSQITSVPENTIPYFNPQGGISFIPDDPDDIEWAEKNGGKRIW
jgi:hypothetical protein